MNDAPLTYKQTGVDIESADQVKGVLKELVESTRTRAVRGGFGSFGGRFSAGGSNDLVASADGVGTKLMIAFRADRHDTVGEDLVNHCVDDILAEGAAPLVFMDYFATGRLSPRVAVEVVEGVARGCRANECALLGGETAEMPGFYRDGEYDLAGFIIGRQQWPEVARRDIRQGDLLVGLPSSGFHTNGYSFIRAVVFDRLGLDMESEWPGSGESVAAVLLRVHRSYLTRLRGPAEAGIVRAAAHVTGGGIPGNLSRILPVDLDAIVDTRSWEVPNEFRTLAEASRAPPTEMYRTLNMGIGMVLVVRAVDAGALCASLAGGGGGVVCGEIVSGEGRVRLEGLA